MPGLFSQTAIWCLVCELQAQHPCISITILYSFLNFTSSNFFTPHTSPKKKICWIPSLYIINTTAVSRRDWRLSTTTLLWTIIIYTFFNVEFQKIHLQGSYINFHLITIVYKKVSSTSRNQIQGDKGVLHIYSPFS